MELFEYLNAVRRRWYVPAVLVVVAIVVVLLVTDTSPQRARTTPGVTYNAQTTMVADATQSGGGANLARTAFLVTVGEIPERAAAILGDSRHPAVVARSVTATADTTLGTLQITANHRDPDRAVALADAFAAATLDFFTERGRSQYQGQRDRLADVLATSESRVRDLDGQLRLLPPDSADAELLEAQRDSAVNQYRIDYEAFQQLARQGNPGAGLEVLQDATAVPLAVDEGFRPPESRTGRLLAGSALALVLGIILALVIDRLDTRLRTRDDFEEAYGVPVLAEVPAVAKRRRGQFFPALTSTRRMSVHREAHRSLRTQLQLRFNEAAAQGRKATVVVVTSAVPREGKTTTVASLAAMFAETGRSVLVLSADFRRPSIHRHLGVVDEGPGLTDVLSGAATLEDCVVETAVPGVSLVRRGMVPGHPQNLLDHAGELLEAAKELADVVLVDTAPVLVSSDTAEIVVRADQVIVVGRSGRTGRGAAVRAADLLASLCDVVGVVVVGIAIEGTTRYAYYYDEQREPTPEPAVPPAANGSTAHREPAAVGAGPEPAPSGRERSAGGPQHARGQRKGGEPVYRRTPGCFVAAGMDGVVGHIPGRIDDISLSDDALLVWNALREPAKPADVGAVLARDIGTDPESAAVRARAALAELEDAGFVSER